MLKTAALRAVVYSLFAKNLMGTSRRPPARYGLNANPEGFESGFLHVAVIWLTIIIIRGLQNLILPLL